MPKKGPAASEYVSVVERRHSPGSVLPSGTSARRVRRNRSPRRQRRGRPCRARPARAPGPSGAAPRRMLPRSREGLRPEEGRSSGSRHWQRGSTTTEPGPRRCPRGASNADPVAPAPWRCQERRPRPVQPRAHRPAKSPLRYPSTTIRPKIVAARAHCRGPTEGGASGNVPASTSKNHHRLSLAYQRRSCATP